MRKKADGNSLSCGQLIADFFSSVRIINPSNMLRRIQSFKTIMVSESSEKFGRGEKPEQINFGRRL